MCGLLPRDGVRLPLPLILYFAAWVAATHGCVCHVIATQKRPPPLEHWALPAGGSGQRILREATGQAWHAMSDDGALLLSLARPLTSGETAHQTATLIAKDVAGYGIDPRP